jgi:hypothetical protein
MLSSNGLEALQPAVVAAATLVSQCWEQAETVAEAQTCFPGLSPIYYTYELPSRASSPANSTIL